MFSSNISETIVVGGGGAVLNQLVHTVLMGRPLVDLQEMEVNCKKVD